MSSWTPILRFSGGRREGGGLKLFGQCPYRTNTFKKGASLTPSLSLLISKIDGLANAFLYYNAIASCSPVEVQPVMMGNVSCKCFFPIHHTHLLLGHFD